MDFDQLVLVYEQLEQISSGNQMREILSNFFKEVPSEDIALVSYLTLGQIASEYEGVVLGIAEKTVIKSISIAGGMDSSKVQKILTETGDAGLTAERVKMNKQVTLVPVNKLTIQDLFLGLHKLADFSGSGSQDIKINLLSSLLQKASPKGAKYLIRIALGTLRLGVGDMTILDSLALAFTGEKKNKEILERAYNLCPDVGVIAETLSRNGLNGINKIGVKVGRPIKMMLGQRVKELAEISTKIPGEVTVEAKYDGERIQAHKTKQGKIILFSRRLENVTSQFPDLIIYLSQQIKAQEFIVEGEVIAIDKDGKPLPFQTLMQRRRKYEVEEYVKKIPLAFKLFDLLYLNGESFLSQPYYQRSAQLEKIIKPSLNLSLTEKIITADLVKIESFFQQMLKSGYEGIFIKSRAEDSGYQAGVRGWNWIKWKKEYVTAMVDTFDLVIVGAFYGRGKRSGRYGALLCAVFNPQNDTFETFCKLGTGLTDKVLSDLPDKLKPFQLTKKPARLSVKREMEADVWFEPRLVVEVFGAEITKSPFHTCAHGLALRFPRFIRFREDKDAEQATTSQEILELFKK